jgi:hypothetical protein
MPGGFGKKDVERCPAEKAFQAFFAPNRRQEVSEPDGLG